MRLAALLSVLEVVVQQCWKVVTQPWPSDSMEREFCLGLLVVELPGQAKELEKEPLSIEFPSDLSGG